MSPRGAGSYARAIERAWACRVERPVVLSPRDWARVADWHARGVPLAVIEDALDEAAARAARRGRAGPRRLASIGPAVEESWQAIVDGRGGEPDLPPGKPAARRLPVAAGHWRSVAAGVEAGPRIEAVLGALEAGEIDAEEADARLEAELPGLAGAERLARVDAEIDARLAGFADRLGPEQIRGIRRRARVEGLRRALGLGRLGESR